MSDATYEALYQTVLDVVIAKAEAAGRGADCIEAETDLMEILDSFGVLDAVIEVEERTGINVDLAEVDFEGALTVSVLTREIIRINTPN